MLALISAGSEPNTRTPWTALTPHPALITHWNALTIGIVTGFALAAGSLVFNLMARRAKWIR